MDAFRTKKFKRLSAKWERVLDEDGLANIEELNSDGEWMLKNSASNVFRGNDALTVRTRLEFFMECSRCCQITKFKSKTEQLIMEMYCDGVPQQEIKKLLKCHRHTIARTIQKYLILYGLYGK